MANAVFDRIGDLADSLTGKSNRDLMKSQINAQNNLNQHLFDLEKEKQARLNSPEYKQQQTYKMLVIIALMAVSLFFAYKILLK